jgi:hypothetical protein
LEGCGLLEGAGPEQLDEFGEERAVFRHARALEPRTELALDEVDGGSLLSASALDRGIRGIVRASSELPQLLREALGRWLVVHSSPVQSEPPLNANFISSGLPRRPVQQRPRSLNLTPT